MASRQLRVAVRTVFRLEAGHFEVLNPTTATPRALTVGTGSEAETAPVESIGTGLAAGASSYVVDLWIDLVSQAGSSAPTSRLPSVTGLTRQQFRALNCLHKAPLTIHGLAQCLGISTAAATATADRLVVAGAAERFRDALDGRLVRVVATVAGMQMASDYRATQVAILETLLGKLEPERRVVLALAMKQIAKAMDWTSIATVDNALIPAHERWMLN
jgi:DNA-binding MarR family transcriptional regulator